MKEQSWPSLARVFHTPMETPTVHRVGARGLQARTPAVGRVPSRGVQGCEISRLASTRLGAERLILSIAVCLFAASALCAAPAPPPGDDGLAGAWRPGAKPALTITSTPGLNLKPGFTIETRIRPTDISDGRNIVFKDKEYALRIDWPIEGSRISFFIYCNGQWEPRASAYCPATNQWCHVVAAWDGHRSSLWVDGEPFSVARGGPAPPATDNPVVIGSSVALGTAFVGEMEYVRIYGRTLPSAEILGHAYGIEPHPEGAGAALTEFDFSKGLQGWQGRADASARAGADAMLVTGQSPRGYVLHQGLDAPIGKKDFLSLRMTLDRGTRGELIFVTTVGAGRIRFPTRADGKPHTYVIEPWTWQGWGGRLLALGLAPSESPSWTAAISYLRLTEQVQAEPELSVVDIFPSATLPRSGRPETIVARIRNMGGTASNVQATLTAPPGVTLKGSKVRPLGTIAFRETREATWTVRASGPTTAVFQAALKAKGAPPVVKDQLLRFHDRLDLPRADYVPNPCRHQRAATRCGRIIARCGRRTRTLAGVPSSPGRSASRCWDGTTRATRKWPTGTSSIGSSTGSRVSSTAGIARTSTPR